MKQAASKLVLLFNAEDGGDMLPSKCRLIFNLLLGVTSQKTAFILSELPLLLYSGPQQPCGSQESMKRELDA
jgi:hypothetical protein